MKYINKLANTSHLMKTLVLGATLACSAAAMPSMAKSQGQSEDAKPYSIVEYVTVKKVFCDQTYNQNYELETTCTPESKTTSDVQLSNDKLVTNAEVKSQNTKSAISSNDYRKILSVAEAIDDNNYRFHFEGYYLYFDKGILSLTDYPDGYGTGALWGVESRRYDSRLIMQGDGNLVMYDTTNGGYTPVWASNTQHSGAEHFVLSKDGYLLLIADNGTIIKQFNEYNGTGNDGSCRGCPSDDNLIDDGF